MLNRQVKIVKKNQSDIKIKAAKIIADQLKKNDSEIDWSQSFTDLGADSLDKVELVIKLEDTFKIEIDDQTALNLNKLDDVLKMLS